MTQAYRLLMQLKYFNWKTFYLTNQESILSLTSITVDNKHLEIDLKLYEEIKDW